MLPAAAVRHAAVRRRCTSQCTQRTLSAVGCRSACGAGQGMLPMIIGALFSLIMFGFFVSLIGTPAFFPDHNSTHVSQGALCMSG